MDAYRTVRVAPCRSKRNWLKPAGCGARAAVSAVAEGIKVDPAQDRLNMSIYDPLGGLEPSENTSQLQKLTLIIFLRHCGSL